MPIRAATPADVPAVLPMVRALAAMHESWDAERYGMVAEFVEMYAQWLPERATDPRSVFLVAEDAGCTIGFLIATVERSIRIFRVGEFGYIHDVWVEAASRERGVGAALLTEAIAQFRGMGVEQVRLETAAANAAARQVFAAHGFRISSIEMLRATSESADSPAMRHDP